jgi:hypothetical protein
MNATNALITIAIALVTGWFSYLWGKRSKIDEVRIKKVHELIQSIATSFQIVHALNTRLPKQFHANFDAMKTVEAGVERLKQYGKTIYADDIAAIERQAQERSKLHELMPHASVYLPKALCDDLQAYLDGCAFAYSNVWPLFDTYIESLFENLLDEDKARLREDLAEKIMDGLRKAAE